MLSWGDSYRINMHRKLLSLHGSFPWFPNHHTLIQLYFYQVIIGKTSYLRGLVKSHIWVREWVSKQGSKWFMYNTTIRLELLCTTNQIWYEDMNNHCSFTYKHNLSSCEIFKPEKSTHLTGSEPMTTANRVLLPTELHVSSQLGVGQLWV